MKCQFKNSVEIKNPLYSKADFEKHNREQAKLLDAERTPYPYTPTLTADPGYVLEHPQAWMHCCPGLMNATPIATPADDECREKTVEWLRTARPAKIAELTNLYEQRHKFPEEVQKSLTEQAIAHGIVGKGGDPNAGLVDSLAGRPSKKTAKPESDDSGK